MMADFNQALRWLITGERVRRKNEHWFSLWFIIIKKGRFVGTTIDSERKGLWTDYEFSEQDVKATDWELFEPEKYWNLRNDGYHKMVQTYNNQPGKCESMTSTSDVRKCKELILQDLSVWKEPLSTEIIDIVVKRFGDL